MLYILYIHTHSNHQTEKCFQDGRSMMKIPPIFQVLNCSIPFGVAKLG